VLGIENLLSAMPARLSVGQAHQVALGRLLLACCDTLLLNQRALSAAHVKGGQARQKQVHQ